MIPDGATVSDMIGIAVDSVIEQAGGNCATIEIGEQSTKWIQIIDCTINCHYPHKTSPDVKYPELTNHPLVAGLESFEEETHMTVSLNGMNRSEIVAWIEQYLTKVLSADLSTLRIELRMDSF